MDYVLISPALTIHQLTPNPVHLNADFPTIYQGQAANAYRSSDHDPVIVKFTFLSNQVYLPLVGR